MKSTLLARTGRLIASVILAMFAAACTQIDTGNVGVESVLGQVKNETLPSGNYFTLFKHMTEVCGKEVPMHMDNLQPQTSDKITLNDLDVDIYLQIDTARAPQILTRWAGDISEEKGEGCERIGFSYASRQAKEVVYDVASKFPSTTIHTSRAEISAAVHKELQSQLDKTAGVGLFKVGQVNVRKLVTDPALDANIKAAANSQFQRQQKENEKANAQIDADKLRIQAQGEADAIRIKSQAIAAQGGDAYVALKAVEKWNGVLPQNTQGAIPFIHVGK
jgi:regulator of protease activity HflC (stomatin/prohibitin superfamily)